MRSEAEQSVDRLVKRGRIKIGATVWMDFRQWTWPELPHGDSCIIFDIVDSAMDGYLKCVADNFGQLKNYGNGSLYVKELDIVSV